MWAAESFTQHYLGNSNAMRERKARLQEEGKQSHAVSKIDLR